MESLVKWKNLPKQAGSAPKPIVESSVDPSFF